jgi:monoamine oxidase
MSMTFAEHSRPKIVVVGAGIAGLTTAHRLQQKGADVHLYEARGRVGGRIFTVKVAGNISELGGQNLADGGEAANIFRLVEEFKLELHEEKIPLHISYFTGKKLIPETQLGKKQIDPKILHSQIDELVKTSKNMKEVLDGLLEKDSLLYKTVATKLAAFEGGSIEKLSTLYAETLYYALLGGVAAVHETGEAEEHYLKLICIKEGSALLTEKIAEGLGSRLHLNKVLSSVSKDAKGYTLTFKDGQRVHADIVVLACPCTVYSDISFGDGVIPSEKLKAIRNVQYGANSRILIPCCLPSQDLGVVINDRLISLFSANLYNLFYVGEASWFTPETIQSTYAKDKQMIESVYPGLCSALMPEYAKDQSFGVYEGPVGYSWPTDPYVKGSYSYIASGQEAVLTELSKVEGETVKALFAPIDQLYFAGEHASILMETPGTIEAACESGERAARMILKTFNQSS